MTRFLGIDFGTKRIGLAISDKLNMIASPLETAPSNEIYDRLNELIPENNIGCIVIGIPIDLRGRATHATELSLNFKKSLKRKFPSLEIIEIDERFTSSMAADTLIRAGAKKKERRDKTKLDKVSAAIILQSFLDAR